MSKPSMKSWAEAATMSNDKADTIGERADNQLPHAPIVRDIASYNKVGGALLAAVTGSKAPDAAPDCLSRPAAWAPLDTPYLCHT